LLATPFAILTGWSVKIKDPKPDKKLEGQATTVCAKTKGWIKDM